MMSSGVQGKRKRRYEIARLPSWMKLVSETDPSKLAVLFDEARKSVEAAHVPGLLKLYQSGGEVERVRAFVVVRGLAEQDDERLGPEDSQLFERAVRATTREEYPRSLVGRAGFEYLRRIDQDEAKTVIGAQDPTSLNDEERRRLVADIGLTGSSERILDVLRAIKKLGGEAGRQAERTLEGAGLADMRKINALARRWRRTRDARVLHELYLRYIAQMQGKVTIAEIVNLAGRPDKRDGYSIWYVPDEWSSLYLEGDSKGVLQAMKFTD